MRTRIRAHLPRWWTRTFGGAFPMRDRVWVAVRHSAIFNLLLLADLLLLCAAVLVIIIGLWWIAPVLLLGALACLEIAWRKGAV